MADKLLAPFTAIGGLAALSGIFYVESVGNSRKITGADLLSTTAGIIVNGASDDATDASPAFNAAVTASKALATTGYQYGNSGEHITVPKSTQAYRLASTIDVDISARFEGHGTGSGPGIWSTLLHPDAGVTAIRTQTTTTTGDSGTYAGSLFTGNGALFIGIGVVGRYNGTTNLEVGVAGHAYHLRATAALRDGGVSDMQGDGVHIHAGVATPGFIGNANGWEVTRFFIQNCTNGISTKYSDSNTGLATLVSISACRAWGIDNNAGAGNMYLACAAQLCGTFGDGTAAKPSSMVHRTGNHYAVRAGQEAWCSVNAPSGDTSSNTGWIWFETGGIVNPGCVDWFNGIVCRAGGSFHFGTAALGIGLYWEASQPPPQFSGDSIVFGGSWGIPSIGGATINANSNQLQINDLSITGGGVSMTDDHNSAITVGRSSPGNPALIGASAASPSLTMRSPSRAGTIVLADTELDLLSTIYIVSTHMNPFTTNVVGLGGSGHLYTDVWATNNVIQTSDANHKSHVRDLSHADFDKLLDAVGAVPLRAYKWKDVVEAKGKEHARDHYGIIAQELHDELEKRGLDPFAGGVLGADIVLEEFEEEVEIEQEAMRTEYFEEPQIEIVDGKAIRRMVLVPREIADWVLLPVHDEEGNPVIIPARPPSKKPVIVDGEIAEVEVPGTPERPMTHRVRRMEKVKVMMPRQRVKLDANGDEEFIWNVRYAEFHTLHAAWQRRELQRLSAKQHQ